MKPRCVFGAIVVSCCAANGYAQPPSLVIDQVNGPAVGGNTVAVGGPSSQVIAQTVTVGVTGRLWAIRVPIGCADGELILEIRNVAADGTPGPVSYRRLVFTPERSPEVFPPMVTADFKDLRITGRPLRFAAGETFAFLLSNPTSSCGVWRPMGGYPDGVLWYHGADGPPWTFFFDPPDLAFQTVVRPGR